jgi:hypothetical protein
MEPGYLVITNDVASGAEVAFERWYQGEHLTERLGVPGFHNARRYVAIEGGPRYLAFYETDSIDVLTSAPYRARLEAPTPLTREIMPFFRNTYRTVMQCDYRTVCGLGALLDLSVFDARRPDDPDRLGADLMVELARDPAFEGLALLSSAYLQPVAGTSEGKLRDRPDASFEATMLVHWAALPDHLPRDPRPLLETAGLRPSATVGGRYRLIAARGRFDLPASMSP